MRPTILEVNLSAFEHNVRQIEKYIKANCNTNIKRIMPVIKANAYGTCINTINSEINKFPIVAVAIASEGVKLRNNGFANDILILNQPSIGEIDEIINNDLTIGISDIFFLETLKRATSKNIKVHIEVDTGMGRTGIKVGDVETFIKLLSKNRFIQIEGIYTHLSSADFDEEYTNTQLDKFKVAVNRAKRLLGELEYVHITSSSGIMNFINSEIVQDYCNYVRAGIILYGYYPYDIERKILDLKPTCTLKSQITFLKEVNEGTSIGYSRNFITNKKSRIATIPIGYADGFKRANSIYGHVVINGMVAPIIGNICMDSFMVDVSNIPNVKVGSTVYIWDNKLITVEQIAKTCGTINYEIISGISERVPRVFIKN